MIRILKPAGSDIISDRSFSMRQYTNWEDPDEVFESGYGRVNFFTWAFFEKERIEERGGKVTVWKHPEKNVICITLDHEFVVVSGNDSHFGFRKIKAADW